ncbi:LysE family translocator [Pararhizobium sp. IMCC21322]|uniref:LysE family translocator n=1 Tax=Pararhizobium sp. IMCC21322 TaxID=3067903 RepID=UPI00274118AD|nr:LysE family translocator [Pararhizobium sp. IMCC21322]
MSVEFLITSMIVILLPGTGVLYTLAVGLGRGFRASIAAALGCTFGIVPAAIASIIGLAAIFHTSALAFQIVKYLGAAYLLFMAWRILRDGGALDVNEDRKQVSLFQTALNGTLINVLNPKLSLFFLAFLPQFVDTNQVNAMPTMFFLAGIFMLLTFLVFVLYGGCAALARDYFIRRPNVMVWMKRSFAGAFGFLGLRLALSDR